MMLFGYDQGVFSMSPSLCSSIPNILDTNAPSFTGGVVVTPDFLEVHDLVGPTKTKVLSTVAAIYDIGCFFGAILAFTVGERLGRKKSILLGTVIMGVGTILQASSYSLPQMFIGRIVLG
jgi:MFS family permease